MMGVPAADPYFPEEWLQVKCLRERDLDRHFPAGLCFQLILSGATAGIVAINQKNLPFTPPAVFCLNEQETVRPVTPGATGVQAIHFHPAWINPAFTFSGLRTSGNGTHITPNFIQDRYFLNPFLERDHRFQGLLPCAPEVFIRLRELFAAIEGQLVKKPDDFWPCRSRSYLLQILIIISNLFSQRTEMFPAAHERVPVHKAIFESTDPLVETVITYLHNNYPEDIQLSDLERRFIINRTSLSERFKRATGQPLMNYLRSLRLKVAASLLQETAIPIYEVCERVGFSDLSHFGRSFREIYALAPSEYRAKFCWLERPS